jgi:Uma2 family endonuclease
VAVRIDLAHRVTDEELMTLSARNPGYQFERTAEGRLVVSPTGAEGGRRSGAVFYQLQHWNATAGLGVSFDSSTGFNLPDGSCRSPDASWVRRERWAALSSEQRRGFAPLCPDAVFEVRSASDTPAELRAKMEAYLANGARLGVLVDPESRSVEVYRPGGGVEHHAGQRPVALDPELPGFALDLDPVWGD